jgi:RNA polymerase sigma-70 factor (ECF subfamily)
MGDVMPDEPNDLELIARYKKGDVAALDVLVRRYQRQLFGYIIKMSGNAADADEIFQATWFKVIKKIGSYRHKNFLGWLVRIAHNAVIDRSRRKKPNVSLDAETSEGGTLEAVLTDNGPAPHNRMENGDLAAAIADAVSGLPQKQKEVFLLRTEAELPFKEIAEIQKASINTVLARMQYALEKLRVDLKESYNELQRI